MPAAVLAEPIPEPPPEGEWKPYKPPWDILGVTAGERQLTLVYETPCPTTRNLHATVAETPSTVTLSFAGEWFWPPRGSGPMKCPVPSFSTMAVPLGQRLAGRAIVGRPMLGDSYALSIPIQPGQKFTMPSLIGFSPTDAKRALALANVTGVLHRSRVGSGLERVIAQSPAAGMTLAPATIVKVIVARPHPPSARHGRRSKHHRSA
ncbi:MAG: PASTA domain-containing protein [Solirubrobacteraceae bacterium]